MATQDINRLRQLFEGSQVGENRVQPPVFGAPTPPDPINAEQSYEDLFPTDDIQHVRMQNVLNPDTINYTPETQAMDKYQSYIDQYPEHQDRGVVDKIIAGGLSLGNKQRGIAGGYEAGQKFLNAPHERDVEEWKSKITPLGVAATQENARNVNSRNLAALELKERNDARRLDETERKNRETAANAKIRAQAYAAKANGYEIKIEGDRVMARNPVTLQSVDLGPSGNMDEMDKIVLQGKQAQERADTMAGAAQTRTETKAGIPVTVPGPNGPTTVMIDPVQRPDGSYVATPVTLTPPTGSPRSTTTPAPAGNGRIRATPTMPGGRVLPTEVPPEGGPPAEADIQQPGILGEAYKLSTQPKPKDLERIRQMSAETLDILNTEIFNKDDLRRLDGMTVEEREKFIPKLTKEAASALGPSRAIPSRWINWSGEQAAGDAAVTRLTNRLVVDLIGEMKKQSDTGATGFGQLTGPELTILMNAASKLNNNLFLKENEYLIPELLRIREKLKKIMLPVEGETSATTQIQPIYEQNAAGDIRVSRDNGRTWQPFVKQ